MSKMRVAVVGVGSLGQHHARIAAASEAVDLVAVVDPNEVRGREIAAKFDAPWAPALGPVLADVDAVQIAAPTGFHHAIGLEVLAAGKHVIMEKPLAASLEEGAALLAALGKARAANPGLVAAVGHLERFNPAVTALRAMGIRPHFAEAVRVSPFPMRSMEVDVVMDVMIHDLDLLLALIGRPVTSVEAVGVPVLTPYADLVNARLKFEGGAFATVTASRVARKKERTLRAFGAQSYASLDFASQKLEVLRLVAGPEGPEVRPELVDIESGEPLKLELEAFYAACQGRGQDYVTWADAQEAMKVADRVQKSVAESLASLKLDA
ncbi:Gfo/Idh/MocA family protein [Mesoterricola sediminis]|uniref:UDP-N-acetylglucosamine 3-dehydrogenase n=1 Tax=Mesoterricola sediminis TaxID=2927980 RepID=A0AA48GY12_9BACT|nr:Gfo/Idh/MocA family oxidoreductase [Mesoterricola sediminis]BDU76485.1 UDP-N-acetylglucosamine 3-dehydrogenase [Mesoterricola sediminis]